MPLHTSSVIIILAAMASCVHGDCINSVGSSSNSWHGGDDDCFCDAGTFDVAADAYRRFTYDSYIATGSPSPGGKVWNDVSPNSNYYDTTGIVKSTGNGFKVTTGCGSGNGAKGNVC